MAVVMTTATQWCFKTSPGLWSPSSAQYSNYFENSEKNAYLCIVRAIKLLLKQINKVVHIVKEIFSLNNQHQVPFITDPKIFPF